MSYAVFGAGRVGMAIVRSLKRAHVPVQIWSSREPMRAARVRGVFLCVPEAVLSGLDLSLAHRYVLVSGSFDPRRLQAACVQTFHPLMGFSEAGPRDLRGVPIGVDSPALRALARKVGAAPFALPADRTLYHAACVLGGAGVLAAWSDACVLLAGAGVKDARAVLKPIALKALEREALTGPVPRGDELTIAAHRRKLVALAPEILPTYDALVAAMRRMRP